MLTYVLQSSFYERGMESLLDYLKEKNLPFHDVKLIPFSHELHPDLNLTGNVVYFGSYGMRNIAIQKNWYPVLDFDLEEKSKTIYDGPWKEYLVNRKGIQCEFSEILNHIDHSGEYFMRPMADSKIFSGGIFRANFIKEWINGIIDGEDYGNGLKLNTPVLVAPVRDIESEYRLFVIDNDIITYSKYKHRGRVKYEAAISNFVLNKAKYLISINLNFAPAYCLDLCVCDNEVEIVEVNSMPSSGFYFCDVTKIVDKLQEIYG